MLILNLSERVVMSMVVTNPHPIKHQMVRTWQLGNILIPLNSCGVPLKERSIMSHVFVVLGDQWIQTLCEAIKPSQRKRKGFSIKKNKAVMDAVDWFKHVRYVVVICCEAMYMNSRSLNWISYKRSLESCCQRETTRKNWKRLFVIW